MTATQTVSSSAQEKTSNPVTKSEPVPPPDASASPEEKPAPTPKSLKFWSVFFALCLLGLSTALEATIVTTALPTILQSIPSVGGQYPWVGNAFLLSSAAIQPFIGQLASLFGRRYPLIFLTVAFILGSGIAGGATGPGALIGGRTVQGLGAGGILVLIDVVVCDLVPALHERAKFLGLVRITGAIGSSVGPIVGGAIANKDWRWCFWLNLITGGVALVYLVLFLRVEGDEEKQKDWRAGLKKIDYVGTVIFMGSVTAVLLGLLMGGVLFPWGSANVIVPIVIGFVGWVAFHLYESFGRVPSPVVPSALFSTRTSAAGFGLAFDGALLLYWVIWFLPVYFQGVLGASPLQSGVNQLPLNLFLVPSGVVAGGVMGKTGGKYKVQHFLGFALISLGVGLFTLLGPDSHKAMWAIFQIITAVGLGIVLVTILPAIQVALGQRVDVAKSTAMYAFVRSFGGIWGVTIPSVIFNGQVDALLGRVSDVAVRGQLVDGQAYGFASRGAVQRLPDGVREEVLGVYTDALKTVWQVGLGFALAGFLCVFAVKQYDMMRKPEVKPVLEGEKTDEMSSAERGEQKVDVV